MVTLFVLLTAYLYGRSINKTDKKMKIEIWSDIMCPFCYIGKRNFENALAKFPHKDQIEVEWKSFQLDPSIPEIPKNQNDVYQFVAERKGLSYDESKRMHQSVTQMAKSAGLEYNFDKVIVTNSLKGHKLIQFAKTKGLGEKAEERLFLAFFTEGKNLNDEAVLFELGKEVGLTDIEIREALTNPVYTGRIENDSKEAQRLGANGVPFFVFDRKYAIAGAQRPDVMIQTIEKAFSEWQKNNPDSLKIVEGAVCKPDGECNGITVV